MVAATETVQAIAQFAIRHMDPYASPAVLLAAIRQRWPLVADETVDLAMSVGAAVVMERANRRDLLSLRAFKKGDFRSVSAEEWAETEALARAEREGTGSCG